jgi:hypothetical protein
MLLYEFKLTQVFQVKFKGFFFLSYFICMYMNLYMHILEIYEFCIILRLVLQFHNLQFNFSFPISRKILILTNLFGSITKCICNGSRVQRISS